MTNVKELLTTTLMDMMETTPLEKITVKDVADKCGVSRQSFYYHFSDIYDILKYIFIKETEKALNEYSDIDSWQLGYVRLMKWSLKNKNLVLNTFFSIRREYVEVFMSKVLYKYIIKVVTEEAKGLKVTKDQCDFIANFYTLAINAQTADWLRHNMTEKPEKIAEKVSIVLEGTFRRALLGFQDDNRKKSKD